MERGTFTFNGINSKDTYDIYVEQKPKRKSPSRNIVFGNPSNRNGSIIRDLDKYPNGSLELDCWFRLGSQNLDDISDWLNTPDYVDFIPWYDAGFTYRVIVVETPELTYSTVDDRYVFFTLKLSVLPFKYQNSTYKTPQAVSNNFNLVNPYNYNAYPLFTITSTGTADVVLTVNGVSYTYKKFNGTLTIDSLVPKVSQPALAVGLDFPLLKKGSNLISFTNASSVTVVPRFARRLL